MTSVFANTIVANPGNMDWRKQGDANHSNPVYGGLRDQFRIRSRSSESIVKRDIPGSIRLASGKFHGSYTSQSVANSKSIASVFAGLRNIRNRVNTRNASGNGITGLLARQRVNPYSSQ